MDAEGLDLTPQLIISNSNDSSVRGMLLIDKNMTTCVEVNASSASGEFHFRLDLYFLRLHAFGSSFRFEQGSFSVAHCSFH